MSASASDSSPRNDNFMRLWSPEILFLKRLHKKKSDLLEITPPLIPQMALMGIETGAADGDPTTGGAGLLKQTQLHLFAAHLS